MIVQIKLMEGGIMPVRQTIGASGMDCHARFSGIIPASGRLIVPLGFSLALPVGYEAQVRPRSGLSKRGIVCSLGTIDSDYRGEVSAIIFNLSDMSWSFERGDRVCQIVVAPVKCVEWEEVIGLPDTARGTFGFGSTGIRK